MEFNIEESNDGYLGSLGISEARRKELNEIALGILKSNASPKDQLQEVSDHDLSPEETLGLIFTLGMLISLLGAARSPLGPMAGLILGSLLDD